MKRLLQALLVICVIFLLAGCQSQDDTLPKEGEPFIGGTEGLVASFIEGAPPEYIVDNSQYPFGIAVKLENKGEAEVGVTDAYVEIIGINPIDFGVPSQQFLRSNIPETLTSARKSFEGELISGGQTVVELPTSEGPLIYTQDIHGDTTAKLRANVCYNYLTRTSTKLCVKGDLLEPGDKEEICSISGEKNPKNSGGPLHITSLKEAPVGENKIQLSFVISHVGNPQDTFFAPGDQLCDDKVTNPLKYLVYVNVNTDINGRHAKCQGLEQPDNEWSGFVKLFDKQPRTITCTFDVTGVESTFEKLIDIDLWYKYLESIDKSVLIKDTP